MAEIFPEEAISDSINKKDLERIISMNHDIENVRQAKKSFNHVLDNKKYAGIIIDEEYS